MAISAELDQSDDYGRRTPAEEARVVAHEGSITAAIEQMARLQVRSS